METGNNEQQEQEDPISTNQNHNDENSIHFNAEQNSNNNFIRPRYSCKTKN